MPDEFSHAEEHVHLDVEVIMRETAKAFQLMLTDKRRVWWVPKSQVANPDDYQAGDRNCTVTVSDWIYQQKLNEVPEEG